MNVPKIDLDNIEITSNARFYKLKKSLTKVKIKKMFNDIVEQKKGHGKRIIDPLRDNSRNKNVFLSCLVFYTENVPSFIKGLNIQERKYSYLLLAEIDTTLVVSSLNTPSVNKYLNSFIDDYGFEVIANTFADKNPKYEKISSQGTSILNTSIRKQVFEGLDLGKRLDGNNAIPLSVSVRTDDMKSSISINTSRISSNKGRSTIRYFIDWANEVINGLHNDTQDKFINTFAKPVKLAEIHEKKLEPVGILMNLHVLEEILFENEEDDFIICEKNNSGDFVQIGSDEIKHILNIYSEPMLIKSIKNTKHKYNIESEAFTTTLRVSTRSILLYSSKFKKLYLHDVACEKYLNLNTFLNQLQEYTIVFNNCSFIYTKKELFFSKSLFDNIESFYHIMIPNVELTHCLAEKNIEKFDNKDTKFDAKSLFGIVENHIWNKKGHLICDDLGDEWADHISIENISENNNIPQINFYLSKYGDETTSASKFHDVIGQANKNIGNIHFKHEDIINKIRLWKKKNYADTQITKLRSNNGDWDTVMEDCIAVIENPLVVRNMYLVVSFFSLSKLKEDISEYNNGKKNYTHIPQLLWFISSYISQCKTNDIQPYIICKP